jgi:hypothetical protein
MQPFSQATVTQLDWICTAITIWLRGLWLLREAMPLTSVMTVEWLAILHNQYLLPIILCETFIIARSQDTPSCHSTESE